MGYQKGYIVRESEIDRRLDRLIEIADHLDEPLDDVIQAFGRCNSSLFKTVSDKFPTLPLYMKSKLSS